MPNENHFLHALLWSPLCLLVIAANMSGTVSAAVAGKEESRPSSAYFWQQMTASAAWPARSMHAAVSFRDELWVLGGGIDRYSSESVNDVWSSTDGIDWVERTAHAAWTSRMAHSAAVFREKVWIMGGLSLASDVGDVWWSDDGIAWTGVPQESPWTERSSPTAVSEGGILYLLGGLHRGTTLADVWQTANGSDWTCLAPQAPWSSRAGFQSVLFSGGLWILGGVHTDTPTGTAECLNDVWTSPDGAVWTPAMLHAAWRGRDFHAAVAFDRKIWVLGGEYVEGTGHAATTCVLNDVWYSEDGTDWHQAPNAPWAARSRPAAVTFGGKLWVLGGNVTTVPSGSRAVYVSDGAL